MNLFNRLNQQGTTVLVATHDINLVKHMGKRIIRIERGRIIEDKDIPKETVILTYFVKPYYFYTGLPSWKLGGRDFEGFQNIEELNAFLGSLPAETPVLIVLDEGVRDQVPDIAKLHYSGRLACQTKNAEGLKEILQDYFQISVDIEQFIGQWIDLPPENYCRLGESLENAKLGCTLVVGSRFWECQQKFRIKLGPMGFDEYQRMLPEGSSIRHLDAWVKNYVGDELSFELQLILRASEIPSICLGNIGQLGWSTWLGSKTFDEDADDLILGSFVA